MRLKWKLVNDNKIIEITETIGNTLNAYGPFRKYYYPRWELIRLTNDEMKMKTTFSNGKEYIANFKGF